MKKYSFKDHHEHEARLAEWRDKWIVNAMSTAPMTEADRVKARDAVKRMYEAANLKPPSRIVFVPSPFVMRYAGGFAAAIWHLSGKGKVAPIDVFAATRAATHDATRDATDAATDAATRAATRAATHDATRAATRAATHDATRAATHDATRDATKNNDLSEWFVFADVTDVARRLVGDVKLAMNCTYNAYRMWQGGNQWAAWDSYVTFFRHVAQLPLDYSKYDAWETLSMCSGPRIVHPEFCIVSDRPRVLKVDAQNRPHCDDGPFCRWSDGAALYAVHGVRVPAWIIEKPETITAKSVQDESNAEVRRVMIEKMTPAKYISEIGAKPVHVDDFGTLYRAPVQGDEDLVMVKVVNSTPEPDGSKKDYWLRVPPEMKTAKASVAWTFGMSENEYQPSEES